MVLGLVVLSDWTLHRRAIAEEVRNVERSAVVMTSTNARKWNVDHKGMASVVVVGGTVAIAMAQKRQNYRHSGGKTEFPQRLGSKKEKAYKLKTTDIFVRGGAVQFWHQRVG